MAKGTVYWITGLSGAGKTTIGRILHQHLACSKSNVVFLDGDILRDVFGNDLGHTREDRLKSAMRNARLCKMLSEQGIDVVCATISMFHSVQKWNRDNISLYKEIFIDAPLDALVARDIKGIYKHAVEGKANCIVGVDIEEERPLSPDFTVWNDGTSSPLQLAAAVIEEVVEVGIGDKLAV